MSVETAEIETLVDFPALREVRNALWKASDVHGAAVMVGSGFSRFADRADQTTRLPPLWSDFHKAMTDRLYPDGGGPCNTLALADEYRATLTHSALASLVRSLVRDQEWSPAKVHHELLALPWTDVLTTNWDTLLERCVESNPELEYDIVRELTDISRTKAPRIVKLHGSFPSLSHFILTEEDFRTYPRKFAPYVNLARQVLLENELCLIGFSGEDPNFLQWSGWVRDQLGASARPIRLMGYLKLSDSRRRLLYSRNIEPIDLAPLVVNLSREQRHPKAIEALIVYLQQGKPATPTWHLGSIGQGLTRGGSLDERLGKLTETWAEDRSTYPGWILATRLARASIRSNMRSKFREYYRASDKVFAEVSPAVRLSFLYEMVWRCETALASLPRAVEDAVVDIVSRDADRHLSMDQRVLMRKSVVSASRRRRDWKGFDRRIAFLERLSAPGAEIEGLYERCLKARDELDYVALSRHLERITGDDPIWLLRRAALTADVADGRSAAKLLFEASREIRRRRAQNRRSLWLLSLEAWATWLMGSARYLLGEKTSEEIAWPLEYKAANVDPWDEIQSIEMEIAQAERRQRDHLGSVVRGDVGDGREASGVSFGGAEDSSARYRLTRWADHIGVPLRLDIINLIGSQYGRALLVSDDRSSVSIWAAVRAVATHDMASIDSLFSEISIARMPLATVAEIAGNLREAIQYGKRRIALGGGVVHWTDRTRNMTDLLSRLSVRFRGDAALDLFQFAVSLVHDPDVRHWLLWESLSMLLAGSLRALEPDRRREVALEVLELPLVKEKGALGSEFDWNVVVDAMGVDAWKTVETTSEWSARVSVLINAIRDESSARSRQDATYRMVSVFRGGALTEEEANDFGSALWCQLDEDGLPKDTSLGPDVFLEVPSPDARAAHEAFDAAVVHRVSSGSMTGLALSGLVGASRRGDREDGYRLDESQALSILERVLDWHPDSERSQQFIIGDDQVWHYLSDLIGEALASSVLPAIRPSLIEEIHVKKFFDRIRDGSLPSLLKGLPALGRLKESVLEEAIREVQRGLMSQKWNVVGAALGAVWSYAVNSRRSNAEVPRELVDETLSICLLRRDPGLVLALRCVRLFVEGNLLASEDLYRLSCAMELLRVETSYNTWAGGPSRSDVGAIRKEVVKLALAMKNGGREEAVVDEWLEVVEGDPVPEVRYALRSDSGA